MNWLNSILVPVHRDGYPFIAFGGVITVILFFVFAPLGWISAVATAALVFYFRDPHRVTPRRVGLVVSPVDGLIREITHVEAPEGLGIDEVPLPRIVIDLDFITVRVGRVPASGQITTISNGPSEDVQDADLSRAFKLRTARGFDITVVHKVGRFIRRISWSMDEGQRVRAGERFGIIHFGGRLEVYLDKRLAPLVAVGQRTIAGETVLADERSTEAQRVGEVR